MASYNPAMAAAPRPAVYGAPMPVGIAAAPLGTFAPGTKIQVGGQKVVIQKYFSEGGFAHVYLVKLPKPIDGTDIAILKRVAVPDKENLANMRTEVETMKKLKGHRPIVTYYDSHASQLKGGGYEVFLLMEFCNGGGLIDFMNTRLQNRLTEPEILKIFSDVTEGVACMHYLKPPLLHRDLKVENVLITTTGTVKRFKLCDFGSTAPPRPAAKTASECRLIEEDIQKHTTLQYRSPEMIDVYRKLSINEKSDIWALGVLLYKLCYYTTPFEEQGQLAILNASFKFPAHPPFSDRLKKLIASMLRENPQARPNVYQVLREACLMQGIEVPIRDIYVGRTESEGRRNERLPSPGQSNDFPPTIGAVFSPPVAQKQVIPDVVPMRRGRPTTTAQPHVAKPSPSPMRVTNSDPFAALDSSVPASVATDDVAARFPSLDEFSLLHDSGSKFEFDGKATVTTTKQKDLSQRVTEKLADDAFATSSQVAFPSQASSAGVSRAQKIISSNPALQEAVSLPSISIPQIAPSKPMMVSAGTMTSPTEPPSDLGSRNYAPLRVNRSPRSDHHRSTSLPRSRGFANSSGRQIQMQSEEGHPARDSSLTISSLQPQPNYQAKHASSSRPSLESGRPSTGDVSEPLLRTHSVDTRPRPSSTYLESNMDYLRERESNSSRPGFLNRQPSSNSNALENATADTSDNEERNIESNVEFLRTMEDQEAARRKERRASGGNRHAKRSSLPSMSLAGTKNLLAGKFGEAFKRFELNSSTPAGPRAPSPLQSLTQRELTPIAGSEATDGRSDDGQMLDDMDDKEDMAPEMKRDLERRRLSMEERRVADAAAAYRRKLADQDAAGATKPVCGMTKAISIQQKVKSLLDENQRPSATKTAEGYGRFTDTVSPVQARAADNKPSNPFPKPVIARKPVMSSGASRPLPNAYQTHNPDREKPNPLPSSRGPTTATPSSPIFNLPHRPSTLTTRPSAPPKPIHLNSNPSAPHSLTNNTLSSSPPKPKPNHINNSSNTTNNRALQARPDMSQSEKDGYVADFSKRFPSLSTIEMGESSSIMSKEGSGIGGAKG